ncbi:5-bromo-4-chloroindolyl phosphate hydrolysis family protein [Anoxybacteroides amylolyticum]|uniref:5-bromo-4-chloroindolyl phosphate hydrolysis family protein n=1 Tax=Anoxybacteroides amylolyticum TaxID=294699 RepID=A0A160F3E3_9BACL|nr:5-bromo-4-chloroindolyl phosphate hydrolysis family protein [Anoxybacillus amylolyticus]ANB60847.1 5-bromo-4-chloroindolyl phosphate hydrolysis family protein [Anoxybacillus amylolyticus]
MKRWLMMVWRWFVSWNIGLIAAVVAFFSFGYHFFLSFLSGTLAMVVTSIYMKRREQRIVAPDLLKEEKRYIQTELAQAWKQWKRIRRARLKVRSLMMWQKISHLSATIEKMIRAVEQDPRKFRLAQSFFLHELDSSVTMIEKYVYLVHQPVRNADMQEVLCKTERLLDELVVAAEKRLLEILSDDVFALQVETKLLEQSLEQPLEHRKEQEYESVR